MTTRLRRLGPILIGLALLIIMTTGRAWSADETQATTQEAPAQAAPAAEETDPIVGLVIMSEVQTLAPGSTNMLVAMIGVAHGFHLNSDKPPLDFLTPTQLTFKAPPGVEVTQVRFPKPVERKFPFAEQALPVFEKMVPVHLTVRLADDLKPGKIELIAKLSFQACSDTACLPPGERVFSLTLPVGAPGDAAAATRPQAAAPSPHATAPPAEKASPAPAASGPAQGQSWWWMLWITFLGGLALNLTPCCYPLIPITIAYFGGQASSRAGLAGHALAYLIGIMATYTALGTFAALTGGLLGSALQHPLTLVAVAAVLLALAGSMFGWYEFKLPAGLTKLGNAGSGRRGYLGSLLMGLTLGIVAAPCLGPLTLGALTFVAQTGRWEVGAAVFGSLSFGLGLPLAAIGLASSKLKDRLPTSGPWLEWVRRILGAVLLVMAAYLLRPLFSDAAWLWLMAATGVAGAVIAWFSVRETSPKLRGIAAVLWLAVAAWFALSQPISGGIEWVKYSPQALQAAHGRPVVLDFYADWCAPCRKLAENMADPRVEKLIGEVTAIKVDLSKWDSPGANRLRQQFGIKGVPTLIFIGRDGRELTDLRLIGAVPTETIAEHLKRLLSAKGGG